MDIRDLYQKVAEFEARISKEAMTYSQCRKGCARCCYTDISIFEVEAANIRFWYQNLPEEKKAELQVKWETPTVGACAFLHEESCTIYEARPLICRTQGLAMTFKDGAQQFADICPLNEDMLGVLTENEFINLDLLNMILSQLENAAAADHNRERVSLSSLRNSFQIRK